VAVDLREEEVVQEGGGRQGGSRSTDCEAVVVVVVVVVRYGVECGVWCYRLCEWPSSGTVDGGVIP
jgi:hypothetical protein